jgi:hypothetical protein
MSRVSFGEVWDQTRAFAAKEFALLAPVALACFAIPLIIWSIVEPETLDPAKPPPPGPWMIWPLPLFILQLMGWLTLASLTLIPGISVREAIRQALRRLPVALGILLVLLGVGILLAMAIAIVMGIVAVAGLGKEGVRPVTVLLMVGLLLVATTRLMVLWPNVAEGKDGPIQSLRRALHLTKGEFWRLFGLLLLAAVVSAVLTLTADVAGGSVMLLLGRMIGNEALGRILAVALSAIVVGLWQMLTVVYVAFLYRAYAADGLKGVF